MSNALSESLLESEGASEGPPPGRGPSRYLRADTLQVLRKNPRTFKIRASTGGRFRSDKHIESLDYDLFESKVNREAFFRQKDYDVFARARWVLTFLVGVLTALAASFIAYFSAHIAETKFTAALDQVEKENLWASFFVYTGTNAGCVLVSALLVAYMEPFAAGSGIPEIKVYLNGVKLPRVVRLKTLFTKMVGVTFSVGGGLPVGKEGPMIHSGAVVGAGVSQGKSSTIGFNTKFTRFYQFRNDREKRDFVACGTAAGVAAAFGAPIGGVMFALEEGASFWHPGLTFRAFVAAMTSMFTLELMDALTNNRNLDAIRRTSDFVFGAFARGNEAIVYGVGAIPIFIIMGAVGGMLGAIFNDLNIRITHLRMRYLTKRWMRVAEAVAVALVVSISCYLLSVHGGTCQPILAATVPSDNDPYDALRRMTCPEDEYNDMGSLAFTSWDRAIQNLFHFNRPGTFTPVTLTIFFLLYFFFACYTYGLWVPSGLFIPSLLVGAAYGRLVAEFMHRVPWDPVKDDGVYALVGAAAMLGGMARMAISLTVILMESTGDIQSVVPMMITLVMARWVGNMSNESLYDMHIHVNKHPFLEPFPPRHSFVLKVKDIMSQPAVCLKEVESVRTIMRVLESTSHNCFPVIRAGTEEYDDGKARSRKQRRPSAMRRSSMGSVGGKARPPMLRSTSDPSGARPTAVQPARGAAPLSPLQESESELPTAASESQGVDDDELLSRDMGGTSPGVSTTAPLQRQTIAAVLRQRALSSDEDDEEEEDVLEEDDDEEDESEDGSEGKEKEKEEEEEEDGSPTGRLASWMAGAGTGGSRGPGSASVHPEPKGGTGDDGESAAQGASIAASVRTRQDSLDSAVSTPHGTGMGPDMEEWRVEEAGRTSAPTGGKFGGVILRRHLTTLLHQLFREGSNFQPDERGVYGMRDRCTYAEMEHRYPRFPHVEDLDLRDGAMDELVDLRPYVNRTPHVLNAMAPVPRAFTLLRGLGLRHIVCVDRDNYVRGMLTRGNFDEHEVEERLEDKFGRAILPFL